jgi:hypothetical protein
MGKIFGQFWILFSARQEGTRDICQLHYHNSITITVGYNEVYLKVLSAKPVGINFAF